MKPRYALLFLGLVILPTALLSILAGRALRNWELVVLRRVEVTAKESIRSVSDRLQARLEGNLEHVRSAMAECVADGSQPPELAATAARLSAAHPEIGESYLFMNPWGFIYPEPGADGTIDDALIETLRKNVASADVAGMICTSLRNVSYCFVPLGERKLLYAGYRVDPAGFKQLLAEILGTLSDEKVVFQAEGPGLSVQPTEHSGGGEIEVEDPLGLNTSQPAGSDALPPGAKSLAEAWLLPPFDHVRVRAIIRNPDELQNTGSLRARLYIWAIGILAGGIVAGGWIVVREALAEARRARARSDFVVGVSHDLRTPIASVKVLAESLQKGRVPDPEKQKKFHGVIVRESERLSQLIERVLFFVRFGQDALHYHFAAVDIGPVAESAVRIFQSRFDALAQNADSSHPAIRCEIPEGLPSVSIDEKALTQLLLNLLDNAAKYARPGMAPLITLSASGERRKRRFSSKQRSWVRLDVRDEGIGIRRANLKRIFRQFYRVPETTGENVSGVGLGLALCRHVAEAHGGWIEASSVFGEGSTFSVYLPAL